MSGASLSGVIRAAASRALERAVCDFSVSLDSSIALSDCLVTKSDFESAIEDVLKNNGKDEDNDNHDSNSNNGEVEA